MMATKLLSKLGLAEGESKLLSTVIKISTAVCVLIVGGAWLLSYLSIDLKALAKDPGGTIRSSFADSGHPGAFGLNDLDVEAHMEIARRYLRSGQADLALPHLRRVASVRRDDLSAAEEMTVAFLELGLFGQALENIDRLLLASEGAEPSETMQVRRGIALYHLERAAESREIIEAVLGKNPDNAQALCFMGQMIAASPDPKEAEAYFRRAMEADPTYAEAPYQLSRLFEAKGDYKAARGLLRQTLRLDPLSVRAHARLGMVYYYEVNAEEALKSYQTALAINPHDYNTRYNLGELYRTLYEDNLSALKEFVQTLSDAPYHSEANYKAGLICVENGMIKEGIRYFEAALESDRNNIRRLLQLAAAYERLGDTEKALSIYYEITDIDALHSIAVNKVRALTEPY